MDNKSISFCPICGGDDSPLPVAHGHSINGNYVSSKDLQLLAELKWKPKRYQVNFFSTNAEVEAENEEDAIEKAKTLYYEGELSCEVESVEEVK